MEYFYEAQVATALRNEKFEKDAIRKIFYEILVLLTEKDIKGNRYIDTIPTEHIHKYVQDLEILHSLKSSYESSEKMKSTDIVLSDDFIERLRNAIGGELNCNFQ